MKPGATFGDSGSPVFLNDDWSLVGFVNSSNAFSGFGTRVWKALEMIDVYIRNLKKRLP